jgi:hypothetical protein
MYQPIINAFIVKQMAWSGTGWSRTVWNKMRCHAMVQNGMIWSGVVSYGTVIRDGMVYNTTECYGMI